jgi:lipopolysaccharide biosynthesis glycosyltransferase
MENYYIVKEEIIGNNTFNEGVLLRTTDKERAEKIANKTFSDMSKVYPFIGAIEKTEDNKRILYNAVSGDSYIIEIEEYNSKDIE